MATDVYIFSFFPPLLSFTFSLFHYFSLSRSFSLPLSFSLSLSSSLSPSLGLFRYLVIVFGCLIGLQRLLLPFGVLFALLVRVI